MAAVQKHTAGPIFKLRRIIGGDSPMSQPQFAKLVDVPFETIRSIETGRRRKDLGPTPEVLDKIKFATAAAWNPQESMWEFAFKDPLSKKLVPFTYALYLKYRHYIETPPIKGLKDSVQAMIQYKVKLLLAFVSDTRWYPLLFKIEKAISQWRSELEIEGKVQIPEGPMLDLREFLEESRPAFVLSFDDKTGEIVQFIPIGSHMAKGLPSELQYRVVRDPAQTLPPIVKSEKPTKRPKRKP
jgi:hypothetical protein